MESESTFQDPTVASELAHLLLYTSAPHPSQLPRWLAGGCESGIWNEAPCLVSPNGPPALQFRTIWFVLDRMVPRPVRSTVRPITSRPHGQKPHLHRGELIAMVMGWHV